MSKVKIDYCHFASDRNYKSNSMNAVTRKTHVRFQANKSFMKTDITFVPQLLLGE